LSDADVIGYVHEEDAFFQAHWISRHFFELNWVVNFGGTIFEVCLLNSAPIGFAILWLARHPTFRSSDGDSKKSTYPVCKSGPLSLE